MNSYWDRGLLGLAVDSDFANNHYVYLLYTAEIHPLTPDGSDPAVSRLARFELSATGALTNETILLGSYAGGSCPAPSNTVDCIPSDGASHSIGTVRSAPDGTLYVGSGDAASFATSTRSRCAPTTSSRWPARSSTSTATAAGCAGHAFCPADANLDHVCTKVFAKGFRNPYRFKLRPGGGLTVGDVGWNTREEVDFIDTGGRSYGWPCYEGGIRTPGYDDLAECAAEYAKEGTANAHVRPGARLCTRGASAIVGGPTYPGSEYPAGYRDTIFFGDYAGAF